MQWLSSQREIAPSHAMNRIMITHNLVSPLGHFRASLDSSFRIAGTSSYVRAESVSDVVCTVMVGAKGGCGRSPCFCSGVLSLAPRQMLSIPKGQLALSFRSLCISRPSLSRLLSFAAHLCRNGIYALCLSRPCGNADAKISPGASVSSSQDLGQYQWGRGYGSPGPWYR